MNSHTQREFLSRICQLAFQRESEDLAENFGDGFIKSVLFSAGNTGLSVPEIAKEIDKRLGLKDFPVSVITSAVARLSNVRGELSERSGRYFLTKDEYNKVAKIGAERKAALSNVESDIIAKVERRTKSDATIRHATLGVLHEFLVALVSSESSFIGSILSPGKKAATLKFPLEMLEATLEKIGDGDLRQVIRGSFIEAFGEPSDAMVKLLYEIVQNCVILEMAKVDPEYKCWRRSAFSGKTFILDTNVLFALLLKDHPRHGATDEIISLSQRLKVKLVFTRRTKQEWLEVLEKANQRFQFISSTRPSLLGNLVDIFIRSYFQEKAANPSLSWQDFYSQMSEVESLARRKGITLLRRKAYDLDILSNAELIAHLSGEVYDSGRKRLGIRFIKSNEVSQHDAYHLLLVRRLREDHPSDMLGPGCWFLTHDPSLLDVDQRLNELLETPSDYPSSLAADITVLMISPFLGSDVSESRLAETYVNLMRTHFAATSTGLNASKIIEVLSPWLSYKSLSDEDMEAILNDPVVTRYYNELREARLRDPEKLKALSEKMRQDVDRKVWDLLEEKVHKAEKLEFEQE